MKLLLVNPGRLHSGGWGPPANGHLFLLFSFLRQARPEVEVAVLDLEHELGVPESPDEVRAWSFMARQALQATSFDMVALSCWTSLHYGATLEVARICRELDARAPVVVGGSHPSAVPEDFLFADAPFDAVVRGPGEHALAALAARPPQCTGGPVVVPPGAAPPLDHALLWDEFLYFRNARQVPIWFSRGCPFSCTFCQDRATGWQAWSPARAVAEVDRVRQLLPRVEVVNVHDAIFGARRGWRRAFLEALAASDRDLRFWAETRADTLDPEDAPLLGRLRFRIDIGLDAVNPALVRLQGKSRRPERYLAAFSQVDRALDAAQVAHFVYLLLNHPGETTAMLAHTVDWAARRLDGHQEQTWGLLSAQTFKLFPGTEVATRLRDLGAVAAEPGWWRAPAARLQDLAGQVVSSPDKLARGAASAHLDAQQAINALGRLQVHPKVLSDHGAEALAALGSHVDSPAFFDDKRLRLSAGTLVASDAQGSAVLQNPARATRRIAPAREGDWLGAGLPAPPPAAADPLALFAGGFVEIVLDPPPMEPGPLPRTGTLRTALGDLSFALLPDEAPRTVASFAHLVRAGMYRHVRLDRSCPGMAIWVGLLDPLAPSPYRLPAEPTPRPVERGSLLMDVSTHVLRFAVARAAWPRVASPGTVFGQVTGGLEVLDGLVAGDVVQTITLDPG